MAGAAGREDGGAGEGRRPARPQWRSLSERKRAVAAGAEGGAGAPPRPCQPTCGGPVEGAAPRRALTGPRRGPDARRSPAVPLGVARPRPAPADAKRLLEALRRAGCAEPAAAAPRSRWPGPSPLRGGTWVARRARVCGFGGGWSLSPALPARSLACSTRNGSSGRKGRAFTGLLSLDALWVLFFKCWALCG